MAQKKVVHYYSDLSGEIAGPGDATVRFALDGTNFEIDLTTAEQKKLRDLLAPYAAAARTLGVSPRGHRATSVTPTFESTHATPREIREWAAAHGHDVPDRGRIPALVREAYLVAH